MAIDDEYFVDVLPLVVALFSKLTSVVVWVLYVDISAWFPLPNRVVFLLIPKRVLVANVLGAHNLIKDYFPFPWSHLHACQPGDLVLRLRHRLRSILIPTSQLLSLSIDLHHFVLLQRVINRKVDGIFFPDVIAE